jgi:hypothetical protein
LKLSEPLLHEGYMIWLNNYYTSSSMAKFLKSYNTKCAEATKINRKNVPKEVKEKATEGKVNVQHNGPVAFSHE